ncbi:MAG: hypothetical protein ABSF63_00190 [Candidatus Bathyarchaeia archaeon]|jgi:hypothetical protein
MKSAERTEPLSALYSYSIASSSNSQFPYEIVTETPATAISISSKLEVTAPESFAGASASFRVKDCVKRELPTDSTTRVKKKEARTR